MAARRLVAVLLVLLFLSSLAAALAPVDPPPSDTSTSSTTADPATTEAADLAGGTLIRQSIDASNRRPPTIQAEVGDQLQLRITSREPGTIEVVEIGATEDVGPDSPAFFDVLLTEDGEFPVRFLDTERRVGTIEVAGPGITPAAGDAPG